MSAHSIHGESGAKFGPEEFARAIHVSRETLSRLEIYAAELADWNGRQNLVSASSLNDVWRRHFWDSAQLLRLIPPDARTLVDLGSGAGFPGLIIAELRRSELNVTLFEATAKKCRFLEAVAQRLELRVNIRQGRIEDSEPERFDVITARACAPLTSLLGYAQTFADSDTVCLFHKGQNVVSELTLARNYWRMEVQQHQSASDPSGTILEIRRFSINDSRAH